MRIAQVVVAAVGAGLLCGPAWAAFDTDNPDPSALHERIMDDSDRKERVADGQPSADAGLRPAEDVQATHVSTPAEPGPRVAGREAFMRKLQLTAPPADSPEPATVGARGPRHGVAEVPEGLSDITPAPPAARRAAAAPPAALGMGKTQVVALALAVVVLVGVIVAGVRARHHA